MRISKPIRNLHSSKQPPSRFCDVEIEDDKIYLVKKNPLNKKYERIPWDDVVYQVEAAKACNE